jgi:hypothetical protein
MVYSSSWVNLGHRFVTNRGANEGSVTMGSKHRANFNNGARLSDRADFN